MVQRTLMPVTNPTTRRMIPKMIMESSTPSGMPHFHYCPRAASRPTGRAPTPSPAGHPRAEAQLLGQKLPADTGVQHEQDPAQPCGYPDAYDPDATDYSGRPATAARCAPTTRRRSTTAWQRSSSPRLAHQGRPPGVEAPAEPERGRRPHVRPPGQRAGREPGPRRGRRQRRGAGDAAQEECPHQEGSLEETAHVLSPSCVTRRNMGTRGRT